MPLHRLDSAHTALRVVVRRFDFASNLQIHTRTHNETLMLSVNRGIKEKVPLVDLKMAVDPK